MQRKNCKYLKCPQFDEKNKTFEVFCFRYVLNLDLVIKLRHILKLDMF